MAQMPFVVLNLKVKKMDSEEFVSKFYNPEDLKNAGFENVIYERQLHKDALRKRIKRYFLTDEEIDKLFKIIEKYEIDIEKIKRNHDYSKCSREDLVEISKKIVAIQEKMRDEFEKKLKIAVKNRMELVKKIQKNKYKNT